MMYTGGFGFGKKLKRFLELVSLPSMGAIWNVRIVSHFLRVCKRCCCCLFFLVVKDQEKNMILIGFCKVNRVTLFSRVFAFGMIFTLFPFRLHSVEK